MKAQNLRQVDSGYQLRKYTAYSWREGLLSYMSADIICLSLEPLFWRKSYTQYPVFHFSPHPMTRGGHSNNSVVHMCDQSFSKHTLIAISPLQEKHPLNVNFVQFCPQIYP